MDILQTRTEYNALYKVATSASFVATLDSMQTATLFGPRSEAFNKRTNAEPANLKAPKGQKKMQRILPYHGVMEAYDAETLLRAIRIKKQPIRLETLNEAYLALTQKDRTTYRKGELTNQHMIIAEEQEANYGVV